MITPKSTTSVVTRKRTFDVRSEDAAKDLLDQLLAQRHSGSITIYTQSGGVRYAEALDSASMKELPN